MHNGNDPVLLMRDNQLKRIFKVAAILCFVLTLVSVWQKTLFGWHPIISRTIRMTLDGRHRG